MISVEGTHGELSVLVYEGENKREGRFFRRRIVYGYSETGGCVVFGNVDRIPMRVPVRCVYRLEKVDRGLGGILLREEPVGASTLVCRTPGVHMLDGREDLCVLWDIRVADSHKRMGSRTKAV